ncbi:NAD-dependent epimerase/dehydratase family protein [Deinococcus petrolearius]|uniref:NAD-dependent epimerase/dehydratase family protein n=1 Tax=Deinococcus petrolearius TaxID=1751295 RepID=A0ABW1DPI8_9DEIO
MSLPRQAKILIAYPANVMERALVGRLVWAGHHNLTLTRGLDLRDKEAVLALFEAELPDYVFLMPARVCHSLSTQPARWMHDNLTSVANVIHAAYLYDVSKLLCLDCSATFMQPAVLPATADHWTPETLGETRRACAVTRVATSELCDSYRVQYGCNFVHVVASHIYGPELDFGLLGHPFVPTLVREVQRAAAGQAPELRLQGHESGHHDLLHLHDLTDASVLLMEQGAAAGPATGPATGTVTVESGQGGTLGDITRLLTAAAGYGGALHFDERLPLGAAGDAPPGRAADLRELGWRPAVSLAHGLRDTWRWYSQEHAPRTS